MTTADRIVQLERGGTALLVRLCDTRLPGIAYWGPALGEPVGADALAALSMPGSDSVLATQEQVAILPQRSSGWLGRPGLLGHRAGRAWSVDFDRVEHQVDDTGETATIRSTGTDTPGALSVVTEIELLPSGLIRVRAMVRNDGDAAYDVEAVEPALPVGPEAEELLDFTGRHSHERHPQRRPFGFGTWQRESLGGRPGHDAPTILYAGQPGFRYRSGRVWGVHVAYGGNQVVSAEHTSTGWRLLRGGERLFPGEIRLEPGEVYTSPWLVGTWGEGLDAAANRIHQTVRARPQHPTRPRPVLVNTWEAVYFTTNLPQLLALADRAAAIGIERFVLDDGWFPRRRIDHAGLGDWVVDRSIWPQGLHPLVDHVRALGMEFGLWFEPEMVNLDSALAETHPEWIFATEHGFGLPSRQQHVLDLGHPQAYAYLLDAISALVTEYDIAYLKWDHNRALLDAGHSPDFTPGFHTQAYAAYRLMSELKRRHPGLEIESCAGGGGRIDLMTAEVTDRVWVSDTIDAHERHRMVRATGLLLPPEYLGTHVGSGADHTTGRTHSLDFRTGTAIWGHMGVEWDLPNASQHDLDALAAWIAFHKQMRPLLHSGEVVHADLSNPVLQLDGVVAQDRSEALYRLSMLDHSISWPLGRVTLPGLDPERTYAVSLPAPNHAHGSIWPAPAWTTGGSILTGAFLGSVGLQAPALGVDNLVIIHVTAQSR